MACGGILHLAQRAVAGGQSPVALIGVSRRYMCSGSVVKPGTLYVLATPIGNLGDITLRAVKVLQAVDLVAAEDTRRTVALLSALEIYGKPILSCHEHNGKASVPQLLSKLRGGNAVALVTDAGTPVVSDPGQELVAAVVDAGLCVSPIPGPSAVPAALSVCGFPSPSGFVFLGFWPRREGERRRSAAWLSAEPRTVVLFEAPTRVEYTLRDMAAHLGTHGQSGRRVCVAREMTKMHEEFFRGTVKQAAEWAATKPPLGEYTIVVEGVQSLAMPSAVQDSHGEPTLEEDVSQAMLLVYMLVAEGVKVPIAIKRAAAVTGVQRSILYNAVLKRKDDTS